jgi:hypothetical protein
MEIDQIANQQLPFMVLFEILQKLRTILEIANVEPDLISRRKLFNY